MSYRKFRRTVRGYFMKKIIVECYSRVAGYFRPVNQWNPGKQSEFSDRKEYIIPENINAIPCKKVPL